MIARLWHTGLTPGRERDYETFAAERSLPMFAAAEGLRGVLLLGDGLARTVLTLWEDAAAIARFEESERYRTTVRDLLASGILAGEQRVERHAVTGGRVGARQCPVEEKCM